MILCGLAASCATTTVMAQATGNRSSYFLEGSVYRHELNPAFQGERNYVGIFSKYNKISQLIHTQCIAN